MDTARQERLARLWSPPNGRNSSELDIVSSAAHSARKIRGRTEEIAQDHARKIAKIERSWRAQQAVKRALIHLNSHKLDLLNPPLIDGTTTWPLTVRDICRACCHHFDVNMLDFLSPRRHKAIVRARMVAMWLARKHTRRSMPEIGRTMGGRDHTTILHGIRRIDELLPNDERLRADVTAIRVALEIEAP
jgi:chromosomal replication initiation ATPase DnaA